MVGPIGKIPMQSVEREYWMWHPNCDCPEIGRYAIIKKSTFYEIWSK